MNRFAGCFSFSQLHKAEIEAFMVRNRQMGIVRKEKLSFAFAFIQGKTNKLQVFLKLSD